MGHLARRGAETRAVFRKVWALGHLYQRGNVRTACKVSDCCFLHTGSKPPSLNLKQGLPLLNLL